MKNKVLFILAVLLSSLTLQAQITTSALGGKVTIGNTREEVIGATVTAKHLPSGTIYRAITNMDGIYSITGMRAGGPYSLEVSYIGFQPSTTADIQLPLGQTTIVDAALSEDSEMLQEVQVVAAARNTMRSDRSGAVTSLNQEQIGNVPTVGRLMTDLKKLTPQSSSAIGLAIGGGNYRQSSVTIDGASFNDSFGLGGSPLPGGGTPI